MIRAEGTPIRGMEGLFRDRRVQLFLGKFLSGELNRLTPIFDPQLGYRYPEVEAFVDGPDAAEAFLLDLERRGLLVREPCGLLVCCPRCGSCNIEGAPPDQKGSPRGDHRVNPVSGAEGEKARGDELASTEGGWLCRDCGSPIGDGEGRFRRVFCFQFSEEGIGRIADRLVVAPVREFLGKRGYRTVSPGSLVGESEVLHSFDIVAYSDDPGEGALAIDFVVSDGPAGEEKVIAMFAKVFDTDPLRSVLIAFPGLTENARRLSEQYRISVVESGDVGSIFKKLMKIIPPPEEAMMETLDVMTLLSLPDHLRRTATVVSGLGRGTAEEISDRTSRARAVESGYLNQLVRMGYLKKEKRGREVLFSVSS